MTNRPPKARDLDGLRALVRAAPPTPGRVEAFGDLIARRPPGLNRTLRALALDSTLDQPMRLRAVSALGAEPSPASLRALREVVDVDDEPVRQRALARLGKIGTVDDLATLKTVRTGNRTTQRVLRAAKQFLSYRHGVGEYRLDAPRRTFAAGTEEAVVMRTGALTKTLRTRLDARSVNVAGIDLATDRAWRVECPQSTFVFVADRSHVGEAMASLAQRQAMPGVLVKEHPETGAFEPAFYIMTDPDGHGGFHVFGVRGSGAVALYGKGAVEGDTVSFDVKATEAPIVPPLTVRASYTMTSDRIRFEMAAVESKFADAQQRRRRQPREG